MPPNKLLTAWSAGILTGRMGFSKEIAGAAPRFWASDDVSFVSDTELAVDLKLARRRFGSTIRTMRVLITGGPGSEPIDQVRVITNRSTGKLAVTLADKFLEAGHQVELYLGRGALFRRDYAKCFETNDDLKQLLSSIPDSKSVDVVLHAAALSDFGIAKVFLDGKPAAVSKIPSETSDIRFKIIRKEKVIAGLRGFFGSATIIGWKLEMDGDRDSILQEAQNQLDQHRTDACVVNGRAYGEGFGICTQDGLIATASSEADLGRSLIEFVGRYRRSDRMA